MYWLTDFCRGCFVNFQGTGIVVLPDDGVRTSNEKCR